MDKINVSINIYFTMNYSFIKDKYTALLFIVIFQIRDLKNNYFHINLYFRNFKKIWGLLEHS